MSAITFRPAKDAELAWVDGQIHFSSPAARELTQEGGKPSSTTGQELNMVPILDALTSAEASSELSTCQFCSSLTRYPYREPPYKVPCNFVKTAEPLLLNVVINARNN